jgi:hypothetical protein
MRKIRKAADLSPVLLACIIIDLDYAAIERIPTVLVWPGDPELLSSGLIHEVRLETVTADRDKGTTLVADRSSRLGERDSANARRTDQSTGLVLDVHDACLHLVLPLRNSWPAQCVPQPKRRVR